MQVNSPAKINLFLEVLGKLENGFHKIDTVFCSIDLFDTLRFTLTKSPGIKIWSNLQEMVSDTNLVVQMASYLTERYSVRTGLKIDLEKRIPLAAGLGGGSSNAAMTLIALNKLWNLELSQEEQESICQRFGSDITFFLHGGSARGTGKGDRIESLPDIEIDNLLLVNPGLRIPSRDAYQRLEPGKETKVLEFDPRDSILKAYNRLEHAIRKEYIEIDQILNDLESNGAVKALMSGSGSTCIGFFDDDELLASCLNSFAGKGYWTHRARTLSKEEYWSNVFKA
ncbi:MAG: 4-(cytidine 5'-diphospho)-2-C-methyl-D-erythritol kinase [Candidatus Cloacimonetes bacterium]|nr:4-(cytidine 5'-diphospho)-2-C-methyl-D-erythritol kinase [Candidatus Cloacimonadota bacterium]